MAQETYVTPDELKAVLEEFCQRNGGGDCSVEAGPARYGGVTAELVWAGFDGTEISQRQERVRAFIHEKFGLNRVTGVRAVYTKGVKEKAAEEARGTYRESELQWLRERERWAYLR